MCFEYILTQKDLFLDPHEEEPLDQLQDIEPNDYHLKLQD